VQSAEMICRSYMPYGYDWNGSHSKECKDGQFEIPGCDPEGTAEVFFLDAKNRLGAVARLSGKEADKPATIRLQPCGSVTVRIVDEQGKPVPKFDTWVWLMVTPGMDPADQDRLDAPGKQAVFADVTLTADNSTDRADTDADGRVAFRSLIPGATYRLGGQLPRGGMVNLKTEFKVEPGKALDVGEIRVKKRE
jgi:hypothetical protein